MFYEKFNHRLLKKQFLNKIKNYNFLHTNKNEKINKKIDFYFKNFRTTGFIIKTFDMVFKGQN